MMMKTITLAVALGAVATVGACGPTLIVGAGAAVTRSVFQERTTGQALTDVEIDISLQNSLSNHSGELFRDVLVDVSEGRVVLTGTVPKREDQVIATRKAWEVPGVREVHDELSVREDSGTQAYLTDVWISNKVRYQLLTDLDVRSVNYNITTVDNVVYVTGLARSEMELTKALNHAGAVGGVKRVINYALTIDDPRRIEQLAKTR